MAVLKPIISSPILPLDSTLDNAISFQISASSDQCFGNRIMIYNNATNALVYDNTVTSFILSHDIPINTLQNGQIYKVAISYFNISSTYSPFSDFVVFKCLATPTVSISNVTSGELINNNTFLFQGSWSQANGDILSTYEFYLYDNNNNLLQSSPTQFYAPSNTIQYQFGGFINNSIYGIQLKTLSQSGVEADTGIVQFTVQYVAPTFSGVLGLTNLFEQGAIQVQANVVQVIGQVISGSISFQNNDWVDLTQGVISFDTTHGLNAFSNFTLRLWIKNIEVDNPFLIMTSPQGYIELVYEDWNHCINCYKNITGHSYMIFGQELASLTTSNEVYIQLQQINNYMNIEYEILN